MHCLLSLVVVCCLFTVQGSKIDDVQDLNFEPKICIECGEVSKHVDVDTGAWTDVANKEMFCSNNTEEILQFCQKTYPNIAVTNIVEANENVTLCSDDECRSSFTVTPYRCLVGKFEADALSYPPSGECDFGYEHESTTCKNHAFWKERASAICKGKGKDLIKYGILIPCGIDLFTGVEYVCCKKSKTESEKFEDLLNKFASRIPHDSKGCDRSDYDVKAKLLHETKDATVKTLAKNLKEAKDHMEALKNDDPSQAKSLFHDALKNFEQKLKNIEKQGKLDESRLKQLRRECLQMNINHKKHVAMKNFVNAARHHVDKPMKVIKTFRRFMEISETDIAQNGRILVKKVRSGRKGAKRAYLSHQKLIKSALREGVGILKRIKSVHGKINFDLPWFAKDIEFKFAHELPTTAPPPTTQLPSSTEFDDVADGERDEEHEHYTQPHPPQFSRNKDHPLKSRAVFAAVIGLSCGALVIMVVIVLALFFRKGSPKRSTKTVIADDDSQEKRHLLKMQEAGFENPTYKFFAK